jgi:hypothetical protein
MPSRFKDFFPSLENFAPYVVLTAVGTLLATKDVFQLFAPGETTVWILLAAIVYLFASAWIRNRKLARYRPLVREQPLFKPFALVGTAGTEHAIWPREQEAAELLALVRKSGNKHIIITGPSGAGKSTFVNRILSKQIAHPDELLSFDSYDNFAQTLVAKLLSDKKPDKAHDVRRKFEAVVDVNNTTLNDVLSGTNIPALDSILNDFFATLDDRFSSSKCAVIAFDQVERLLSALRLEQRSESSTILIRDLYIFIKLLRYLRGNKRYRTLLIIRSEYLYTSVEFLEFVANRHEDSGDQITSFFLCPGINTESSKDGVEAIVQTFLRIKGASTHVENFTRANNLDSRSRSNTFLAQLYGFVVEHYYMTDRRVRETLESSGAPVKMVGYYFDYLQNDFARHYPGHSDAEFLKAIMFTIAIENRATGRAITADRLSLLAHIPLNYIEDVINFLTENGLLVQETVRGEIAFRLIHEVVADYVLENEQFSIDPRLKDGIQGLCEAQATPRTKVERFGNPLLDLIEQPNLGAVALAVFFVIGILKWRFETVCEHSLAFWSFMPMKVSCSADHLYFGWIFIVDSVWLWFIYRIHNGYLRYTLVSTWLQVLSCSMPVVGTALAVAFFHSPALFTIPIGIVGAQMGIILLLGCMDGSFHGRVAKENWTWGLLTICNMFFSVVLAGLLAYSYKLSPEVGPIKTDSSVLKFLESFSVAQLATITACVLMFYFWIHIRNKQESRESISARLALHDRTQINDSAN